MFSYILVVYTGSIQSISICLMLKAGTLQSIASSAILQNLFKNYFLKVHVKIWWLYSWASCYEMNVTQHKTFILLPKWKVILTMSLPDEVINHYHRQQNFILQFKVYCTAPYEV